MTAGLFHNHTFTQTTTPDGRDAAHFDIPSINWWRNNWWRNIPPAVPRLICETGSSMSMLS